MSQVRLCDRCGAKALEPGKDLTVNVPAGDPATNPGAVDLSVTLTISPSEDLCAICLASAAVEYVLVRLGKAVLTPEIVAALSKRIAAVLAGAP
jgi:hypothetical protein